MAVYPGTKTYPGLQPMHSQTFVIRATLSAIGGIVLGIMISLIVNCTLLEISLNMLFATYFGMLFIIVGAIILYRVFQQSRVKDQQQAGKYSVAQTPTEEADERRRKQLALFGALILFSGAMCFMLDKDWYFHLSPWSKVPLYSVLGVSVSFALTFSVIDLVNYIVGLFAGNNIARPIVESPNQIHVVLVLAVIMGAIFGFIFGLMQVADANVYKVRLSLLRVEHYCYQIGGLLGCIGGVANEYLRHIEVQYSPVSLEFDDDI